MFEKILISNLKLYIFDFCQFLGSLHSIFGRHVAERIYSTSLLQTNVFIGHNRRYRAPMLRHYWWYSMYFWLAFLYSAEIQFFYRMY